MSKTTVSYPKAKLDSSFANPNLKALAGLVRAVGMVLQARDNLADDGLFSDDTKQVLVKMAKGFNALVKLEKDIAKLSDTASPEKKARQDKLMQQREDAYEVLVSAVLVEAVGIYHRKEQYFADHDLPLLEQGMNLVAKMAAAVPSQYMPTGTLIENFNARPDYIETQQRIQEAAQKADETPRVPSVKDLEFLAKRTMGVLRAEVPNGFVSPALARTGQAFRKQVDAVADIDKQIARQTGMRGKEGAVAALEQQRIEVVSRLIQSFDATISLSTPARPELGDSVQGEKDKFYMALNGVDNRYITDMVRGHRDEVVARKSAQSAQAIDDLMGQLQNPEHPERVATLAAEGVLMPKPKSVGDVVGALPDLVHAVRVAGQPGEAIPHNLYGMVAIHSLENTIDQLTPTERQAQGGVLEAQRDALVRKALSDMEGDVAQRAQVPMSQTMQAAYDAFYSALIINVDPHYLSNDAQARMAVARDRIANGHQADVPMSVAPVPVPQPPQSPISRIDELDAAMNDIQPDVEAARSKRAPAPATPPKPQQKLAPIDVVVIGLQDVVHRMGAIKQGGFGFMNQASALNRQIAALDPAKDQAAIAALEKQHVQLIGRELSRLEGQVVQLKQGGAMGPEMQAAHDQFYGALTNLETRYITRGMKGRADDAMAAKVARQSDREPTLNERFDALDRELDEIDALPSEPKTAPAPQRSGPTDDELDQALADLMAVQLVPQQPPVVKGPPPLPPKPTGEALDRVINGSNKKAPQVAPAQSAQQQPPIPAPKPTGERLDKLVRGGQAKKQVHFADEEGGRLESGATAPKQRPVVPPKPALKRDEKPVAPVQSAPKPPVPPKGVVQKVAPMLEPHTPGTYNNNFSLSWSDVNKGLEHCARKAAHEVLESAGAYTPGMSSHTVGNYRERLETKIAKTIMKNYPDFAIMPEIAQQAIVDVACQALVDAKVLQPERGEKSNISGAEYKSKLAGKTEGHVLDKALQDAKTSNPDIAAAEMMAQATKQIFATLTKGYGHNFYEQREGFNRESSVHTGTGREAVGLIEALIQGVAGKHGVGVEQLLTGADGKMNTRVLDAIAKEVDHEMGHKSMAGRVGGVFEAIGRGTVAVIGTVATLGFSARPNGMMNDWFHQAQLTSKGEEKFKNKYMELDHASAIIDRAAAGIAIGENGVAVTGQVSVYSMATQLMSDKYKKDITPDTTALREEQQKYAGYITKVMGATNPEEQRILLSSPAFYQEVSKQLGKQTPNENTPLAAIPANVLVAPQLKTPDVRIVSHDVAAEAAQGLHEAVGENPPSVQQPDGAKPTVLPQVSVEGGARGR